MRLKLPAFLATLLTVAALPAMAQDAAASAPALNSGDTAWLLVCSALVMLMTPGLAFFYAGMVSRKNVVSTLLQNFVALAVVGILWIAIGYSLVFTESNEFIGGTSAWMLDGLLNTMSAVSPTVPTYAFVAFQMMFAIITPALITGAIAERVRFAPWLWVMGLWSLVVYVPVAHWVWGPKGWLANLGGLDFAGGLVVHMTAGFSALVAALLYGKRYNRTSAAPNDVSMIMLGAALLWFGWFGFNAGSAITSGTLAAQAFMTTFLGAACAFLAWMAVDWIRTGKPTATGSAIGLVVGLVCVTPAAGFVSISSAMIMGVIAGAVCNLAAVGLKKLSHMDDTLDVFACHGIGGMIGAILTGCLAEAAVNPAVTNQGFFIDGTTKLLVANLTGVGAVAVYSMAGTFVIIKAVGLVMKIRTTEEQELHGLDHVMHGEHSRHHDRAGYETAPAAGVSYSKVP